MHDPQASGRPQHAADDFDDLDRLFLDNLERVPVPDDLTARVLASTVARGEATRVMLAWPWLLAGLAALAGLMLAGYQVGASLAASDALDVVGAIADDLGLLATAPGDVLAAVGEVMPWGLVVVAGLSAALLILATGQLVTHARPSMRSRSAA